MTHEKNKAAALTEIFLILAAVSWGLNFVATKYALGFISPLWLVAFRFVVGGLNATVMPGSERGWAGGWRARRDSNPRPADPKSAALIH